MINYAVAFNKSRITGKLKFIHEIATNSIRSKAFFETGNALSSRSTRAVRCQSSPVQRITPEKATIYHLITEFKDLKKSTSKYKQ